MPYTTPSRKGWGDFFSHIWKLPIQLSCHRSVHSRCTAAAVAAPAGAGGVATVAGDGTSEGTTAEGA